MCSQIRSAGTTENAAERPAKVSVEDSIDDRIERRIGVAQPGDEVDQTFGAQAPIAERRRHVHYEEGEPAQHKHSHHDAKHTGGAPLPGQGNPLLLFPAGEHLDSGRATVEGDAGFCERRSATMGWSILRG